MDTLGSPTEPQDPERVTTGKAKRYVAAAALLTGGLAVGALISPIGLADAQSDEATTDDATAADTDTDTDADTDAGAGADGEVESSEGSKADSDAVGHADGHHGHRGRAGLEDLSAIVGLSEDELRAQFAEGLSLAEIAQAQGMSTDALVDALVANMEERLATAVADNRIDQAAADERLAGAEERVREFVERTPGERGEGFGQGRDGHGGPGLHLGSELEELLGLSSDDIRGAMTDGQTLAEIAEGVGVSSDELVTALVAAASARIDDAVADARIDSEQATELKGALEERITAMVNAEPGEGGPRGGFGRRNGHGHHRFGDDGTPADDAPAAGDVEESSYSA